MFNAQDGYQTQRLTASGVVAAGGAVRKIVGLAVLTNGTGAGSVDYYDDASAVAGSKRGGVNVGAASTWGWAPIPSGGQAVSKLYINFSANVAEALVIYQPGGAP